MKCDWVRARLVAFALGDVSQWESNRIASHVGKCHSCYDELDSLHLTTRLLQRLPPESLSPDFPRKLATRLAGLPECGVPVRRAWNPGSLRWGWAAAGVAVAAAALLLMLLVPRPSPIGPVKPPAPSPNVVARAGAPHRDLSAPTASAGRPESRSDRRTAALPRSRASDRGRRLVVASVPPASAALSLNEAAPLGTIVSTAGRPRRRASGETSWRVCREDDPITGDMAFVTADTDRAEIELRDGSRILLDYDTHLEMARAAGAGANARPASLYLRSGKIWLLLTKSQAGMVVQTPTARAEALGTIFSMSVDPGVRTSADPLDELPIEVAPETSIAVLRGKVELSNQHGMMSLGAGDCAQVAAGRPAARPDAAQRVNAMRLQVPWGQKGFIDWTPERLSLGDAMEKLAGSRARLGVRLQLEPTGGHSRASGLVVARVVAGSPAEQADIKPGDRLVRMDELTIRSPEDLARSELLFAPGEQVRLLVERDGHAQEATVTLADPGGAPVGEGADRLERANGRFAVKDVGAATRGYQALVASEEQKPAALNNLGVTHELANRVESAVAAYRQAVRLAPEVAHYRFNLAMGMFRLGNLPRAAEELEAALASAPALAHARFHLGVIRALSGEYEAAMEQARLLQSSPASSAEGYCLMGEVCMIRGEAKDAESWYLRAVQADPLYLDPRIYLARACFVQGRLDEAQNWVKSAVKLVPDSLAALNGLGLALLRRGRLDDAERVFVRAAALYPESGKIYNNLGLLYLTKKGLPASRAAYRKAVALAPDATWCHVGLAVAMEQSGQLDAAKREYTIALRLDPSYDAAYRQLASLYRRRGEVQLAQNTLAKARQYGL